jgi:hypothetical protein
MQSTSVFGASTLVTWTSLPQNSAKLPTGDIVLRAKPVIDRAIKPDFPSAS